MCLLVEPTEDCSPETSVRSIIWILCDFNRNGVPHKLQCYQLFNTFTRLDLTKHHWWGCNTWNVRLVHYINFMPFQQKWRIQVTISFWFSCTVLCYFNKMLYHVKYGVFQHSIYLHGLIWPSITDEDSIPETSVRSILSILCDFNKMAYRINFSVIQFSIHLHDLIWPNITDEDSKPETRVRSIISILCDFNRNGVSGLFLSLWNIIME